MAQANPAAKSTTEGGKQPDYHVYVVAEREGKKGFWMQVGAAWENKDGQGINVVLSALPVDGKLVLRRPKEGDTE